MFPVSARLVEFCQESSERRAWLARLPETVAELADRRQLSVGERFEEDVDCSGVFEEVELGPYTMHRCWGPSDDQPTVGMEILRRFTLTFDVPQGRLFQAESAPARPRGGPER